MKTRLVCLSVFILSTALWAQGEGELDCACSQNIDLTDVTCASPMT